MATATAAWLAGVAFGASLVFVVQGAERAWRNVKADRGGR